MEHAHERTPYECMTEYGYSTTWLSRSVILVPVLVECTEMESLRAKSTITAIDVKSGMFRDSHDWQHTP